MSNELPPIRRVDQQTANKLRQYPSQRYLQVRVPAKVLAIIHQKLLPPLNLKGRNVQRQIALVEQIMANLNKAHRSGACVAIPGDGARWENRLRNQMLDQLLEQGLIVKRKGSEQSGTVNRYGLSAKGIRMMKDDNVFSSDYFPPPGTKPSNDLDNFPVVLRNADGEAVPFKVTPELQKLVDRIAAINERNLFHAIRYERPLPDPDPDPDGPPPKVTLVIDAPNVWVRAIFNGDFQHGGRLYAFGKYGYTRIDKTERRTMTIDGEPIAEFDFSGHHPRMLYHLLGIEVTGDVYRPFKVISQKRCQGLENQARHLVKRALNAALNARDQRTAMRGMSLFLKKHPAYIGHMRQLEITVKELMTRVQRVHIRLPLFTGAGLKLQAEHEQPLLLDILETVQVKYGLPALGLHDGVICRAIKADMQVVYGVMQDHYFKRFGYYPEIKRDH